MPNSSKYRALASTNAEGYIDAKHSALYAIRFVRQRFDDVANRIDGIVWEAEPGRLKMCFVSEQVERILGYTQDECHAEGFWESRIHPEDLAGVVACRASATESETNYSVEYRMRTRDGRQVWFHDAFRLACTEPLPLFRGILSDISTRKLAEDAFLLSNSLFQYSTDGITLTDPGIRILKVNGAFSAITGYAPEELIGKTPAILQSGRQDQSFYQTMWNVIDERGHWTGELWNRKKSGELYIQQLSIVCVKNDDGAVLNYLGIARDVTHSKAVQEKIEQLSYFDAMTGLPNRTHLKERLHTAINHAKRSTGRIAVLAVDLDRLAYINDTLGHHVGDLLLIAVAERLKKTVRHVDSVSRHIGDEFTVILENITSADVVGGMAESLLSELSKPYLLDGHEVYVSACVGISQFPQDGDTPEMLLKHADVALHDAKASGANKFHFFREELNHVAQQRLRIESSLRQALQRNEFKVVYQPQLEFDTGRISGMEALVRWSHPEMGAVSPAQFIPIAEKTGNIVEIGLWVTEQACAETRRWHGMGYPDLRVAVNVSAHQLAHDDFALQIKQILRDTGLPADKLELELTESMIMQRPERVVTILDELRTIGVQFSIDDFGTGYSSLSQLKRFPIDKLKIDQSFTRDIGHDANGTAITKTIIALGHSMGLRVIAEGVETVAQQRFLIDNGCHGMQGYLFSRPVAANDFSCLLASHSVSNHHK